MSKHVEIVAVDDGYLAIKLARFAPGGEIEIFTKPARAERGASLRSMDGGDVGAYRTGEDVWTVAPEIRGDTTRTEDYPISPLLRVLVHHSLISAGYGGKQVMLATGLPVASYYTAGGVNKTLVSDKRANLETEVVPMEANRTAARIVDQRVYPQAIMAYTDHVIGADGEVVDGRGDRTIGVVDVGGRTTDFAVVVPNGEAPVVDMNRSGSVDVGVLNVIDALRPKLLSRFGLREISDSVLDNVVTTGELRAFGKNEDVSNELASAKRDVAERVASEAQKRFGSGFDLDLVLYVGGGSHVLADALAQFRHVEVAPEPFAANARGLLKYMAFVDAEGREVHEGNAALKLVQGGNGE